MKKMLRKHGSNNKTHRRKDPSSQELMLETMNSKWTVFQPGKKVAPCQTKDSFPIKRVAGNATNFMFLMSRPPNSKTEQRDSAAGNAMINTTSLTQRCAPYTDVIKCLLKKKVLSSMEGGSAVKNAVRSIQMSKEWSI